MLSLKDTFPDVYEQFMNGKFVIQKTNRKFSGIAIDQAHEQNNAVIKGDGGIIGITEHESALLRWTVAGPEVCRIIQEYECVSKSGEKVSLNHHEATPSAQKAFLKDVLSLTRTIEEMGNPYLEESTSDLLTLDTKDVMDQKVTDMLKDYDAKGKEQLENFTAELNKFYSPIARNKFTLFDSPKTTRKGNQSTLKDDCSLFSKLFISCQIRQVDLPEFFSHENQRFPAALSSGGDLYQTQKADLMGCLENVVPAQPALPDDVDMMVIDGACLVHSTTPKHQTFGDYAQKDFVGKVKPYARKHKRTDVVFDTYKGGSIKSHARIKRGNGSRRRVTRDGRVPKNWPNFLQNEDNKTELYPFLADSIKEFMPPEDIVYASKDDKAVTNNDNPTLDTLGSNHEEADTKIFVHLHHGVKYENVKKAAILANDIDVIVIGIGMFENLSKDGLQELWICFGRGEKRRWMPIHLIFSALGPQKSKGLLFFHAFSGCDSCSGMKGKGKKSFFATWSVYPDVTPTFQKLSQCPEEISADDFAILQKFTVYLYDKSCTNDKVDNARMALFTQKNKEYNNIPPTEDALKMHAIRAAYQAGYIWGQALERSPELPSPSNWGWKPGDGGTWDILWTRKDPIAEACKELRRCSCKKECENCKCKQANLPCTSLCSCPCQHA